MRLRFTLRATENISAIAAYVGDRDPAAAIRVRDAIYKSLENLILFPRAGRRQKADEVRKLVTRPYPYIIYYTIDVSADEIIVLAVKHPAQERDHEDL